MNDEKRLEAEARYISGTETLKELAEGTGVPLSSAKRWCKEGNWVKKRDKAKKRAMRKAVTKAVEKKARELMRLMEASDEMEAALLLASKAFAAAMLDTPGEIVDGNTRANNLSRAIHALGRQTETRMLLSGMMKASDREKIELLRRKQDMEERKEAQAREAESGGVKIEIGPEEEEDMSE